MYHYVRPIKDSSFPRIKGLELDGFRRQLDYLIHNYNLITIQQLIDCSLGISPLPTNACLLTFDDGYKDHATYVLPELLSRNLQGSFFPPADAIEKRVMLDVNAIHFILASTSDYIYLFHELKNECLSSGIDNHVLNILVDRYFKPGRYDSSEIMFCKNLLQHGLPSSLRPQIISKLFKIYVGYDQLDFSDELYMSESDIRELIKNGMYVGSHGCRHIWLGKQSSSVQSDEIISSLRFLDKVGAPTENWIMCYPYGSYNDDTLNILRNNRCLLGFTTKVGFADFDNSNLLEMRRFDTNDFPQ